jgi:hypothetical protein
MKDNLLQNDSYDTSKKIMQLCETDEGDFAKYSLLQHASLPKISVELNKAISLAASHFSTN